jgi:hypothetical protein
MEETAPRSAPVIVPDHGAAGHEDADGDVAQAPPLPAFVSMLVALVVDMEMLVLQRCVLQVHRIGGRP